MRVRAHINRSLETYKLDMLRILEVFFPVKYEVVVTHVPSSVTDPVGMKAHDSVPSPKEVALVCHGFSLNSEYSLWKTLALSMHCRQKVHPCTFDSRSGRIDLRKIHPY